MEADREELAWVTLGLRKREAGGCTDTDQGSGKHAWEHGAGRGGMQSLELEGKE